LQVAYSSDAQFVLSGSDDTNIRVWKSAASKALGLEKGRDERKKHYMTAVQNKFSHMPEIKRIAGDKPVPKGIKKARQIAHVQRSSERRKTDNKKRHHREDDSEVVPERKRAVLKEFDS
jgi:WD repeat and SOF domain-containing protein 1